MKSPNFNLPRSCGARRDFETAKVADRDFHDPCCCLKAPLACKNADATEKREVLWDDASLCVGLVHAEPRRHRERMAALPGKHCCPLGALTKDLWCKPFRGETLPNGPCQRKRF